MTIRSQFETYREQAPGQATPTRPIPFQSENCLGGLFTDADPAIIPLNAFTNLTNFRYIRNQLMVRNGLQLYSIAKPDSHPLLAVIAYIHPTYGIQFLRFTPSTINRVSSTGWSLATGTVLAGSSADRFSFTVADNRLFFTNNGANVIQEYLPATNTYANLGDSDTYKYITSAFNRVVAAYLLGTPDVSYEVAWSGDINYDEWNPAVDITAGSTPLVNSPSDLSDGITGIFNIGSVLCIPRQKSIWLATNLPSATNPFNFFPDQAAGKIGADTPNTIQVVDNGLVFYNAQRSAVYQYTPGSKPVELSLKIKRKLKLDIASIQNLFSTYNSDDNAYSIYSFSDTTSIIKCYTYYFEDEAWVYSEFQAVASVTNVAYASSDLTINELTGNIDDLLGTIDELGGVPSESSTFFGFNTGELSIQPIFNLFEDQVANILGSDNSQAFSKFLISKTFINQKFDSVYNNFSLKFTPYSAGNINIYYTKDDGKTWTPWKSVFIGDPHLYESQVILIKKPKRARKFAFKVEFINVMASLDSYALEALTAAETITSL